MDELETIDPAGDDLGDLSDADLGLEDGGGDPAPVTEPAAAPSTPDPYEAYGGKDNLDKAHQMWQAAQSRDGVTRLFMEAGAALGLTPTQLETLFGQPGAGASDTGAEEEDPDRLLTAREVQDLLAERDTKRATERQQQVNSLAAKTVSETLQALGLDPAADNSLVLQFGDKYITGDDLSPEKVAAAVRRGHADYQATVEREAKAYLQRKRATKATVPSAPSGSGAPAPLPTDPPKNAAEAQARIKKMIEAGEL